MFTGSAERLSVWRIGGQIEGFEIPCKSTLSSCYFCFLRFLLLKHDVHNPKIWQATEKMSSCCLPTALIFPVLLEPLQISVRLQMSVFAHQSLMSFFVLVAHHLFIFNG